MSKLYIFGIGGTGARVLRSFTMLMAAGVEAGVSEIVPILIDPDHCNADLTRTVSLMNCYGDIRRQLTFGGDNQNSFFRPDLLRHLPNYTLPVKDTNDCTFREYVNLPAMDRANQAMARMLFSDLNLNASMEVGFKGNPNIGSVVLNQIVHTPEFEAFANSFSQGDKIFIVSSIFGGTGASGFPLLLKTLRTGTSFPNSALINQAQIGAVTVMPYFKLKKDHSDEEQKIESSSFISKTKSALAYYEYNIIGPGGADVLYYLADKQANTYDNHIGGTAQQNDAHFIEFLAATALVDFAHMQPSQGGTTVHKEFGLRDGVDTVTFASFYDRDRRRLYKPLTQFVLLSNCLTDRYGYFSSPGFGATKSYFANFYDSPFMSSLRDFCDHYKAWLAEMKGNTRSLDLFNLACGGKPFEVVTGVKPAKVMSLKSDYDLVADRLNSVVGKCASKAQPDRLLEMFSRATDRLFNEKFQKA